ncbi:VOC family protein [Demequina sp. SYSU T00192]|uniref:VOC family protein n=1 Tax=Demequina litoralis TaxID=3051660 RepID=A0ABT8GBE2_9MICO|nr:VOC family protein [Demequina sp. SYSU T00192]MDN4476461.1 VOC family protein [Demequina sp. SYSU T00192]
MGGPRVSYVTLGVADLERSRAFYEAWGWTPAQVDEGIVFYQANGVVVALFGLGALAADQGRPDADLGVGGMTLAQNYPTEAEVDAVFEEALKAGATPLKTPEQVFWGGYSGYVADPDGHVWELAMNPFSPPAADGSVVLGG